MQYKKSTTTTTWTTIASGGFDDKSFSFPATNNRSYDFRVGFGVGDNPPLFMEDRESVHTVRAKPPTPGSLVLVDRTMYGVVRDDSRGVYEYTPRAGSSLGGKIFPVSDWDGYELVTSASSFEDWADIDYDVKRWRAIADHSARCSTVMGSGKMVYQIATPFRCVHAPKNLKTLMGNDQINVMHLGNFPPFSKSKHKRSKAGLPGVSPHRGGRVRRPPWRNITA